MSFKSEKLKIMIRKNVMRISPSIKLKAIEGRTGCRYVRALVHAFEYQASFTGSAAGVAVSLATAGAVLVTVAGDVAQPAAMKRALVSNNGAATKSRTLKISAKTIEPAAVAVVPFLSSSFDRF